MRKVLVINLGWEQAPLIDHLLGRGDCRLYGVHAGDGAHRRSEFAAVLDADPRELQPILRFAAGAGVDAVISDQCDYSHFAQAVVAERLGLPGPGVAVAQVSANKFLQRSRARDAGLLVPAFALCASVSDALQFAAHHGYPAILKPIDNRGSIGVTRIDGPDDVAPAFFDALFNSHSRLVLVEEFIEGVHITVDGYAFARHGNRSLSLATKTLGPPPRQVAMEIVYPGELPAPLYAAAQAVNVAVNDALGYRFGMTHAEYMVRGDEVYLIESANRGGGVHTSEIVVPAHCGIDLVAQYVDDCLGNGRDHYATPQRNPVTLRFFRFGAGRIDAIGGFDALLADPAVLAARLSVGPGSVVEDITNDGNRHGFAIVAGDAELARRTMAKVTVTHAA